jgi:hypothetical protein
MHDAENGEESLTMSKEGSSPNHYVLSTEESDMDEDVNDR